MEPTFKNQEWIIIQKKSSLGKDWSPNRFDIVIIDDEKDSLCKRVIGLPNDKIKIEEGVIYINENKLDDLRGNIELDDLEETIIPNGFVWLIGDNRDNSWYGVLSIEEIKGLAIF